MSDVNVNLPKFFEMAGDLSKILLDHNRAPNGTMVPLPMSVSAPRGEFPVTAETLGVIAHGLALLAQREGVDKALADQISKIVDGLNIRSVYDVKFQEAVGDMFLVSHRFQVNQKCYVKKSDDQYEEGWQLIVAGRAIFIATEDPVIRGVWYVPVYDPHTGELGWIESGKITLAPGEQMKPSGTLGTVETTAFSVVNKWGKWAVRINPLGQHP